MNKYEIGHYLCARKADRKRFVTTLILGRFNLLGSSNVEIRFMGAGASLFLCCFRLVRDEFVLSRENLAHAFLVVPGYCV